MITSIDDFLRWFAGVNRRAMRDVDSLPAEAETWRPPAGEGEDAWSIGELVAHMAGARVGFARVYLAEGWIARPWPPPMATRADWLAALEGSTAELHERLAGTPVEWLSRRVPSLDTEGRTLAGWRVLMMMAEHDVHHRSQIDTYAGLNGWTVEQIFGRTAEQVGWPSPPRSQPG